VEWNTESGFPFKATFNLVDNIRLIGCFSCNEVPHSLHEIPIDLMLIEANNNRLNELQWIDSLKINIPHLKIILVTEDQNVKLPKYLVALGLSAHLVRPVSVMQMVAALRFAILYRPPESEDDQDFSALAPLLDSNATQSRLSKRENEVMKGLAEGLLYKEIANKLRISYSAVHKYQNKVFKKLNITNRSEATRLWLSLGNG
jgi:DNA-binding NarL/FixJ family response regulator